MGDQVDTAKEDQVDTTKDTMDIMSHIMDMITTKDPIIIKDSMAVMIFIAAQIAVTRAMDWKMDRSQQSMVIMMVLDQNILKMVILINHRVTILIDQVATILIEQQVLVQSQIMRQNHNKMERNQANRRNRI